MNIKRTMKSIGKRANDVDIDDVLHAMGLERRRSAIVTEAVIASGCLVLGACIGAGLGLLFAPETGRKMRHNVEERIHDLREKIKSNGAAVREQLQS